MIAFLERENNIFNQIYNNLIQFKKQASLKLLELQGDGISMLNTTTSTSSGEDSND